MIRTLPSSPSSSTMIVLEDFPARIFLCGTGIFPSAPRNTFYLNFLRLNSVPSTILKPIPLCSSSNKASQLSDHNANIPGVLFGISSSTNYRAAPRKTVRVRFQLQKECLFGEHFFILGDDPIFGGLWEPENALPLIWSDGHVWTVDLDLPVGRFVEFKFILKENTGDILWQPGPNRTLETWETNKTIRICGDWENADLQMIIEQDLVLVNQEEKQSSVNLDMPMVTENITHPKRSVRLNTNVSSNGAEEQDEVLATVLQNSSLVFVGKAGYLSDEFEENSSSYIQSEKTITMEPWNGALTAQDANVTQEDMFTEDGGPVLVPGLIPLTHLENEEASGPISHMLLEVINEDKAEKFPEVAKTQETEGERNEKGKVKMVSLFEKSEQEAVKGVEKRHCNAGEEERQQQRLETEPLGTPHVLLEKDIEWGRRTLYKLLSNFGLF